MEIKITPASMPAGKLADAELHFTDGPLAGLKLIGFAVWERRTSREVNVTFPARQYAVNGERRSFALLRPIEDANAQESIRHAIIAAWRAYNGEEEPTTTTTRTTTPAPALASTTTCDDPF